jgi:parallel beta-helix repeat protein
MASDNNTLISNKCLSNGRFGIVFDSSSNNIACNNIVSHTTGFGIYVLTEFGQTSTRNRIWNNTFIDDNGAGSKYSPSHVQANDSGTGNWWNNTNGYGNYWSDWPTPSLPYRIAGKADAKDYYPLTTLPVPIL